MSSGHHRRVFISFTVAWMAAGGARGASCTGWAGPETAGVASSAPTSSYLEVIDGEPQEVGEYPIGARIHRKVQVRNVSQTTVRLRQHSATCSCLDSLIEPAELAPGQSGLITLRAMAGGAPGEQELTVTLAVVPVAAPSADPAATGQAGSASLVHGSRKLPSERVALSMRFRCTAEFYCPMSEFRLFGLAGRPVETAFYVQMAPTAPGANVLAQWSHAAGLAGPKAADGSDLPLAGGQCIAAVVSDPVDPTFAIRTVRVRLPGEGIGAADATAIRWPALLLHGRDPQTPQTTLPLSVTAMMHWTAVVISDTSGAEEQPGDGVPRRIAVRLTPSPLASSCKEGPARPTSFRVRTLGGTWSAVPAGASEIASEGSVLTARLNVGSLGHAAGVAGGSALVIEGLDEPGHVVARAVAMPGVGGSLAAASARGVVPAGQK